MTQPQFVIVRGSPKCLTRGFEFLKSNTVKLKIKTIEYEKERKFKLVDVHEFDPVAQVYEPMGKYYADAVTGTLYSPKTGECLSSLQIKLMV